MLGIFLQLLGIFLQLLGIFLQLLGIFLQLLGIFLQLLGPQEGQPEERCPFVAGLVVYSERDTKQDFHDTYLPRASRAKAGDHISECCFPCFSSNKQKCHAAFTIGILLPYVTYFMAARWVEPTTTVSMQRPCQCSK